MSLGTEFTDIDISDKKGNIISVGSHGGTLGPAKAANAGGVAVSALEMSQNSMRYNWSSEEVDEKLHNIMKSIFNNSVAAAEKYGLGFDLIKGANIAGFEKVVEAMISQGIY